MNYQLSQIKFYYHFRHFIKGIKNRIIKAGKKVSCKVLMEWLASVVNMLWWNLKTAHGKKGIQKYYLLNVV